MALYMAREEDGAMDKEVEPAWDAKNTSSFEI
jgi:hypothetical protein